MQCAGLHILVVCSSCVAALYSSDWVWEIMSKQTKDNKYILSLHSLSPLYSLSISLPFPFLSHPPFLLVISVPPLPRVCSSYLEENLTVGCNAGCSCVRELYNPVCGADGVMYYSPCHAGCSSINHTEHSTGKQVQYKQCSCHLTLTGGKLRYTWFTWIWGSLGP